MTDVHTPKKRSFNMSRIRSRDTKPERLLRSELWRLGYRFRLRTSLPGKPDIVFPKQKLAIFVDGCFWHGCPEHFRLPQTNREFWRDKISANQERDRRVDRALKRDGWQACRIWEHELKDSLTVTVLKVENLLKIKPTSKLDNAGPLAVRMK